MDLAENCGRPETTISSSKIVIKGAEDPEIIARAARLLSMELITMESIPLLDKDESGLQLILIPLEPCDATLLEEVSKTYQKITDIPVKIRHIKENWTLNAPERIPYQRPIQEMLIKMTKEDINFKGWNKDKYVNEMKKIADQKDALDRYYINDLISKVCKEEGQYSVDAYLDQFLDILEKYRSNDPRTMYVGITGINIYSGDNNFIFSEHMLRFRGHIIREKSQASIFILLHDVGEQHIRRI